jgi:hypothetical protein
MINDYEGFLHEGFFIKDFNDRINRIDELLFELRDIIGKINVNTSDSYFNVAHGLQIKIAGIFKDIILKYKKDLNQEQVNIMVNKWKIFEPMFTCYSYRTTNRPLRRIYMKKAENANSFIYQLELLRKFGINIEGFEIYNADDYVDPYIIVQHGEYSSLTRRSKHEEERKKALEKHKDVDPLGEEDWSDVDQLKENITWHNNDGTYDEEDEIDDDPVLISVGDFVEVTGTFRVGFGNNDRKRMNKEVGEVIRIFLHQGDQNAYVHNKTFLHIDPDNNRAIDITIKFDGRNDLLPSKFSKNRDCVKFMQVRRLFNKKTNIQSDVYTSNYGDGILTIKKI